MSKVINPSLAFTSNELGIDSAEVDKVPDPIVEQSNNGMVISESGPGSCVSRETAEELPETMVREEGVTVGTVSKVTCPALVFTNNELGIESIGRR